MGQWVLWNGRRRLALYFTIADNKYAHTIICGISNWILKYTRCTNINIQANMLPIYLPLAPSLSIPFTLIIWRWNEIGHRDTSPVVGRRHSHTNNSGGGGKQQKYTYIHINKYSCVAIEWVYMYNIPYYVICALFRWTVCMHTLDICEWVCIRWMRTDFIYTLYRTEVNDFQLFLFKCWA